MQKQNIHIIRQIKIIRATKIIIIWLLGFSFVLEFMILNMLTNFSEQKVLSVSGEKVSNKVVAVTKFVKITITKEYQAFLDYIKKKHEEQNRNKTENHQFTAFNLFLVEKFFYQYDKTFYTKEQVFNSYYREPPPQKALIDIFHPPQV